MERLIKAWKTLLHLAKGWMALAGDFFLFWPGAASTESTTKSRATERTKRRTVAFASEFFAESLAVV